MTATSSSTPSGEMLRWVVHLATNGECIRLRGSSTSPWPALQESSRSQATAAALSNCVATPTVSVTPSTTPAGELARAVGKKAAS
jgi:hypothetical protein